MRFGCVVSDVNHPEVEALSTGISKAKFCAGGIRSAEMFLACTALSGVISDLQYLYLLWRQH